MDNYDIVTITRRSVHSVVALASRTFFLQAISFITRIVIYTMLTATDIGIYTAVVAIQRVISFFTDFGLGAALIQKRGSLSQKDLATSFTLQLVVTFAIFLFVFFFRDMIAMLFNLRQDGVRLLLALVFTLFLSSFKTIPSILLERTILFGKLIIPQFVEAIAFNAVLAILLLRNFGLDSYTWAFLVSSIIGIPFYYFVSPWRPHLGLHRESLASLKFGLQFQAKNILATIKDDFLVIVLTKLLSFREIGYIGFAQGIAFFIYRYIVDSVTKVTFSTYSRIQENADHLRLAIEKSLFFVSSVIFPVLTGLILLGPTFIQLFPRWGKWEPAIISLIFFSLNAMISSLSGILVNVLDATGRVTTTLKLMVLWTVLIWILTPVAVYLVGYNGVAIASFCVTLTIVITIWQVKRIVAFSFFTSIAPPTISCLLMGSVVILLRGIASDMLSLAVLVLVGGVTYLVSLSLLCGKTIAQDIRFFHKRYEAT
jgi:O-antigen/teichoic acid export membrane protein